MHLDGDGTLALAFLATTAIGVKAEVRRSKAHLLRERLGSKEFPYFVPCLNVCDRIGACALADWVLIHKLDGIHHTGIPFEAQELARTICHFIQLPLHSVIEDVAHEAALTATAYARHAGHHA